MGSSKGSLSILEALENLNTLVDAESLDEIEVTESSQLISHKEEEKTGQEVYWVGASRDDLTAEAIKATFRTVLDYLQSSYNKMQHSGDSQRLVEGINTIMVLVGEATRKLEKLGLLFKEKITSFDEYRQLQHFYQNKVIKEGFKEFAKAPIPVELKKEGKAKAEEEWGKDLQELLGGEETEETNAIHLLNDLDVIKKDHLYELFYVKNEGGQPFYTYELARNIKLACDFGEYAKEYFGDDPLLQIKNWEDKSLHFLAKRILDTLRPKIQRFYKTALQFKEMELVLIVHNALMALMLAANPRNLIRQFSLKGCHRYFYDFQLFLQEALHNRDYQKFVLYSAPASQPFFIEMIDLIQSLCKAVFILGADTSELKGALKDILDRSGVKRSELLSESLKSAYAALVETLKRHPNGPLFKALDLILEEEERIFDPLMQGNIPTQDGELVKDQHALLVMRMPSPIAQEFIHQAFIKEEFKTYLLAYMQQEEKQRHLIVNFQDRTSWKEHARCAIMEELGKQAQFADVLTVVTMAKDTDFYNQMGTYLELNNSAEFIHQFQEHLSDEATGYAFPQWVKKALFPEFIQQLLPAVHQAMFDKKPTLSQKDRINFIELVYHLIVLKLIEISHPDTLTLLSKDGLDIEGTSTVGLFALLGIGQGKKWTQEEIEHLQTVLLGPTLLYRERGVHPERFERLLDMVRLLEEKGEAIKTIAPLFKKETLHMKLKLPKNLRSI